MKKRASESQIRRYAVSVWSAHRLLFFVLLGQLISAAAIDHFGLFTAQQTPLSLTRAAGIAMMAAGIFFTQKV